MKRIVAALLLVFACGCQGSIDTGTTTRAEMEQTEANHERLVKAVPPPQLQTSLERSNLKRRLERFNNETKVSYIYLVNFGKVMAFYPMKGKVSSVNSKLTTQQQLILTGGGTEAGVWEYHVIESPALDGSYGTNGDAVFFFTTDDTYIEWSGDYMLCDKPLKLSTPPELVLEITE